MSENAFQSNYTDTEINFENPCAKPQVQISISDKLNDNDIPQQVDITQNFDQTNTQSVKAESAGTQNQVPSSGSFPNPTLVQQNSKTLTSTSTRKKKSKSKSKSFQNSQSLEINQNYREEVIQKFLIYIKNDSVMANNFEIAIFNKSQLYCYQKKKPSGEHDLIFREGVYQPFFQKYFQIIEPTNYKFNPYLFQQISTQQLKIQDYVQYDDEQLRPLIWEKIIDKIQTEMSKIENDRNLIQPTSSWYRCGRCGHSSTTVSKKQTRSADEGETVNIYCNTCGNSWNQY